jgi:hypothetical protein
MAERPGVNIVEGADAPAGLPDANRLSMPVRAVVGVSAAADVVLRTSASALIATTALPFSLLRSITGPDRHALALYAELAAGADADTTFARPRRGVEVRTRAGARLGLWGQPGRVDLLRFRSDFVPVHPAMRARYTAHTRNTIARAQHWRHGEELRPTIIVVHGFMGDPYWLNSAFFSLPWFFSHGYDVLMVTLPFHGARGDRTAPFSGPGLFAHGLAHINEAMFQAIHDIRVLMDHLESRGVERFGATGLSLGGYITALLAAVDDRLAPPDQSERLWEHWDRCALHWFPGNHVLHLNRAAYLRRMGRFLHDVEFSPSAAA